MKKTVSQFVDYQFFYRSDLKIFEHDKSKQNIDTLEMIPRVVCNGPLGMKDSCLVLRILHIFLAEELSPELCFCAPRILFEGLPYLKTSQIC